jgi:hypothetical protein
MLVKICLYVGLMLLPSQTLAALVPILEQAQLDRLIAKPKWGVIYSISPAMPLSIKALPYLQEIMADLKGDLIVVWDTSIPIGKAKKLFSTKKIKHFYTQGPNVLYRQGMDLHYPTLWIFKNGKIGPRNFVGYKRKETFLSWISSEKEKL